jgi:hypothetical protein
MCILEIGDSRSPLSAAHSSKPALRRLKDGQDGTIFESRQAGVIQSNLCACKALDAAFTR